MLVNRTFLPIKLDLNSICIKVWSQNKDVTAGGRASLKKPLKIQFLARHLFMPEFPTCGVTSRSSAYERSHDISGGYRANGLKRRRENELHKLPDDWQFPSVALQPSDLLPAEITVNPRARLDLAAGDTNSCNRSLLLIIPVHSEQLLIRCIIPTDTHRRGFIHAAAASGSRPPGCQTSYFLEILCFFQVLCDFSYKKSLQDLRHVLNVILEFTFWKDDWRRGL